MRRCNRLLQKETDAKQKFVLEKNKLCKGASVAVQKMEAEFQDAIKLFSIFMLPVLQSEQKTKYFEIQNKVGKTAKT